MMILVIIYFIIPKHHRRCLKGTLSKVMLLMMLPKRSRMIYLLLKLK